MASPETYRLCTCAYFQKSYNVSAFSHRATQTNHTGNPAAFFFVVVFNAVILVIDPSLSADGV